MTCSLTLSWWHTCLYRGVVLRRHWGNQGAVCVIYCLCNLLDKLFDIDFVEVNLLNFFFPLLVKSQRLHSCLENQQVTFKQTDLKATLETFYQKSYIPQMILYLCKMSLTLMFSVAVFCFEVFSCRSLVTVSRTVKEWSADTKQPWYTPMWWTGFGIHYSFRLCRIKIWERQTVIKEWPSAFIMHITGELTENNCWPSGHVAVWVMQGYRRAKL